jgi:16S rRNA (guanine966-N2)-methyltransferase
VRNAPGLRPTPDRVRETLFNWLAPFIDGAACLDLFAGTGALGFEALSRGAARAVMLESNRALCDQLHRHAEMLGADNAEIVCADAMAWLEQPHGSFEIVFIDPPFGTDLAAEACARVVNGGHLARRGLVYVESAPGFTPPDPLTIRRESQAGRVQYMLLEAGAGEEGAGR